MGTFRHLRKVGRAAFAFSSLSACAELPESDAVSVVPLASEPAPPGVRTLVDPGEGDPLAPAPVRGPVGGWAGAWCMGTERLELHASGLVVGLRPGSRAEGVAWTEGPGTLAVEWHVGAAVWVDRREVWAEAGGMVLRSWLGEVLMARCEGEA